MLSFRAKKFALIVLLALSTNDFLFCKPHTDSRIRIMYDGSYTCYASYALHTPLSPTTLPVELIIESNDSNGPCHGNVWIYMLQLMSMRFTLNNTPQELVIWPNRENTHEKYSVEGLDAIHSSIWYPALKKLAMDIGVQWYGKQHLKRNRDVERKLKQTSSCISIKPLNDLRLSTKDTLVIYPSHSIHKPMTVKVDVQREADRLGKKRIVVVARFSNKPERIEKIKGYSFIKFVYTKQGLKELSKERAKRSSKWYPWIKKVASRSVARYLRFKDRHNNVTRIVKMSQTQQNEK